MGFNSSITNLICHLLDCAAQYTFVLRGLGQDPHNRVDVPVRGHRGVYILLWANEEHDSHGNSNLDPPSGPGASHYSGER